MIPNVGVDMLLKHGKLDDLQNGPVYWIDSADMDPCIGKYIYYLYLNAAYFYKHSIVTCVFIKCVCEVVI